ncbi:peroxidasin-like [Stegodyphus dumicola]|uniref:peroxidasin-like n=1 Tax=Stegodyphus dumicola TaxID=202533 RepID=UPI0015AC949D|nr:peroxidasin-like [Stegodyphus dumicola]
MMRIVLVLSAILSLASCCPPAESLHPCTCEADDSSFIEEVTCFSLENEIDLKNAAAACKNRPIIQNFKIIDSALNYIPDSTFEGTFFRVIEIKGTTLVSIGEKEKAFAGLEHTLNTLALRKNVFMGPWNWSALKGLKSLNFLMFNEMELQSIETDIERISFLNGVDLSKNEISWIDEQAFSKFWNMTYLILAENGIKDVKRSMFPNPASMLKLISLRDNQIETLPNDMFQEMPKLETFLIAHNHILTLDEKTFSSIWKQLGFLDLEDNHLACDCRISWIINTKFPRATVGFCSEPPHLEGKNLTKLSAKDLWCFM